MEKMKFSEDFAARPQKEQIEYLMSLCNSQNNALDLMQKDRNRLLEELSIKESQLLAADTNVQINKNIMINSITSHNAEKEGYVDRIQELQGKMKELQYIINQNK